MESVKKKEEIIILLLLLIIPATVGSINFVSPWFGNLNYIDEGQFAAWANHMMKGKLMYEDIYITYGPLYVYPLYLIFKIVGSELFYMRFFYVSFGTTFGLIAAYLLLRSLQLKRIVLYPLLFLVVVIPSMNLRQGILFITLWSILKIVLSTNRAWGILTGSLLALSFLVTPEAGLIGVVVLGSVFLYRFITEKDIRKIYFQLIYVIAGLLALSAVFGLWAYYEGWFSAYLATTMDVLSTFSGVNLPNGKGFPNLIVFYQTTQPGISWIKYLFSKDVLLYLEFVLFIIAFLYLVYRKIYGLFDRKDFIIFLIATSGFIHYYSLVGRSGNFFLALTPAFIILAFFANKVIAKKRAFGLWEKAFLILVVLVSIRILYIFSPSLVSVRQFFHNSTNNHKLDRVGNMRLTHDQVRYIKGIEEYVGNNSKKDDYIFFLSNEPIFYYLTDRLNPTRYDLPYIAHSRDKRYELLSDLKKNPPKLIFYDTVSWPVDEISNKDRMPEVVEYIEEHYNKELILNGKVEVFIRNER